MVFRIVFIVSSFLLLLNCKSEPKLDVKLPSSFVRFYEQFHSDSSFQMAHISFPLSGLPSTLDGASQSNFHWESENWTLHRPMNNEEFKKQFSVLDSTSITEYIYHPSGYGIERRFAQLGRQWNLIYYAGMYKFE